MVYKSPTDLGMRPIQHRPYLFHEGRCGRDITYLIDKRTNKLVRFYHFLSLVYVTYTVRSEVYDSWVLRTVI